VYKRQAQGKQVTINLQETQTRDKYDRLLAYVYLSESESLNLALVRDGHAYADRRFSHPLRWQFEAGETEARKAGRGLWKEITVEQMPEWRQNWLRRHALSP
jgi:endonuclease YncB( thermonuclease family)